MQIIFLGTGDAFGSGGRNAPAIIVRSGDSMILLDCGPCTLPGMKGASLEPLKLKAILLSHLHGDHFGGIPFFYLEYQFLSHRDDELVMAGPPGTEQRVEDLYRVMFSEMKDVPRKFRVRYKELQAGEALELDGISALAFQVVHPLRETAFGYRIEDGERVLCYTGDTQWFPGLAQAVKGADLLIAEGFAFEKDIPRHMSYRDLVSHREELEVGHILITHMGPEALNNVGRMGLETAHDGMVIEL
ncbi:MAG: MBL fold metallo-hydrolase [Deltaproteobacteria bacterium]|nr:MBL fold metallo-hydrolase [Deltaproteobacteria bacterium]MBW2305725.1 MBL fold metallo-hydrolase [Deltaproteobacteria bacterium]